MWVWVGVRKGGLQLTPLALSLREGGGEDIDLSSVK